MSITLVADVEAPVPSLLLPEVEVRPPGSSGVWFDSVSRARIRAMSRVLMRGRDGASKLTQCGLPISENGGGPGLILTEGARIYGGQLKACQSPLRCAWCSPMQWDITARTGMWFSNRHVRAGGWVAHTTLTVPHQRRTDLADSMDLLRDGWLGLRKNRELARWKKRVEMVTAVPVFQVTWSPRNGWHPHYHVAWFLRGDPDDGDEFAEVVGEAWRLRIQNMVGRPVPRSTAGSGGSVVFTVEGFWAYLSPDHRLHPDTDCRHPDHPGCHKCRKRPGGLDDPPDSDGPGPGPDGDDGSWWGGGAAWPDFDQWSDTPQNSGGSDDDWGDDWGDPSRAGLEVLSELGAYAAAGNRVAGAALREYYTETEKRRRVVSGWRNLRARFGDPPVTPVEPPKRHQPKSRVWLHPQLVAAIELRRRHHLRGWVNDGLRQAVEDPWEAADLWSQVIGETVEVRRHDEDGAPVLGISGDLVGVSGISSSKYPR